MIDPVVDYNRRMRALIAAGRESFVGFVPCDTQQVEYLRLVSGREVKITVVVAWK